MHPLCEVSLRNETRGNDAWTRGNDAYLAEHVERDNDSYLAQGALCEITYLAQRVLVISHKAALQEIT